MKRLRWQLIVVFVALAAIAILLLGQPPGVEGDAPEPAEGGVYTEGLVGTYGRLNPTLDYYNSADRDIDHLIFSGLIRFDDRGNPHADLAEAWGISADGLTYNIALREGAVWHDGTPVTTDDVLFTINLMSHADMPTPDDLREFWSEIDVLLFDEQHMQFQLPEPFAPFLDYLTFGIVPKHLLEEIPPSDLINHGFNMAPVGTGPYQFDHLLIEDGEIAGVVLRAFEDYYQERTFIEQIVFRYYDSAAEALVAYQEGQVLGISRVSDDVLDEVLQEPNLNLYSGRLPQLTMVIFNLGNEDVPFFQDSEVRTALMHGLNRQWMIGQIMDGQAIIADGPILPGTWAYYEGQTRLEYDPGEAVDMLRAAGYTIPSEGGAVRASEDGVRLAFDLLHPDDPVFTALAEAIQENWAAIGVQVNLVPLDYATMMADYLDPREYEAALLQLDLAGSPDPDPYPFWHQAEATGGQNFSRWDDRRASEYLERARVSTDVSERERLYQNFQVHFGVELPALPLFYPIYNYAVDAQVRGVRMGPLFCTCDRFATLADWFLVAGGPPEVVDSTETVEP